MNEQPAPRPTLWVMLVDESPERRAQRQRRLQAAGFGVEGQNRVNAMVMSASYRHYDAIVLDTEGEGDVMTGVMELRRMESGRGQPPTPILGIGEVDGLARHMAQEAGFTDVCRDGDLERSLATTLGYHDSAAVPAA